MLVADPDNRPDIFDVLDRITAITGSPHNVTRKNINKNSLSNSKQDNSNNRQDKPKPASVPNTPIKKKDSFNDSNNNSNQFNVTNNNNSGNHSNKVVFKQTSLPDINQPNTNSTLQNHDFKPNFAASFDSGSSSSYSNYNNSNNNNNYQGRNSSISKSADYSRSNNVTNITFDPFETNFPTSPQPTAVSNNNNNNNTPFQNNVFTLTQQQPSFDPFSTNFDTQTPLVFDPFPQQQQPNILLTVPKEPVPTHITLQSQKSMF